MTKHRQSALPSLSMIYRRIAISFVVLTVLLVGIIVFFSVAKATIIITPKDELRSAEFLATARPAAAENDGLDYSSAVAGVYEEKIMEEELQFEASGTTEKQGRSEGTITVINTTSAPQPLVATTRFLSSAGVLFRTQERVLVPAKGSTAVAVAADQTGPSGDIAPGSFTIPGLNAAKQLLIYGESKAAMMGGAQKVRVVVADDLERARNAVVEKAIARAKEEFSKAPEAQAGEVTADSEILEVTFDGEKGEARQTLGVVGKVKVKLLAYDKEALEKLALEKVLANVPSDRELISFNKDTLVIRIKSVNAKTGAVQLQVYADGQARLSAGSPVLEPVKVAGMLPEEAARYLESFDAVEAVAVRLFPSWQKRIPTIPDRIKMVVKK
ncbi:hypothetical protein HYW17_03070 [Candidatus Uhrbacteria bacterium]|nr:hypothetical protein [Candidatus Uhrbacteria bacterium]